MFLAIKIQNYCKPIWGSSGILRGGSNETSSLSCLDEFLSVLSTMVLGRLNIPEIKLPKDLKGWLILSFTFKIMETSESCQTIVNTIITERRQWVKRFCLFSFFNSLTMSSLLHSSSTISSLIKLSTFVFKVSNAEVNSSDSVPSFSDSICWCWRNEFGFQIYNLKKQRQKIWRRMIIINEIIMKQVQKGKSRWNSNESRRVILIRTKIQNSEQNQSKHTKKKSTHNEATNQKPQ